MTRRRWFLIERVSSGSLPKKCDMKAEQATATI